MKLRIYILFSLLLHFSAVWWLRPRQMAVEDLTEIQVIESFQSSHHGGKSLQKVQPSSQSEENPHENLSKKTKSQATSPQPPSQEAGSGDRQQGPLESENAGRNNLEAIHEGVVSEPPKVLQEKKIPYPTSARRAGVEGVVELKLVIDINGQVKEAELVRGPGYGLDEAALGAIKEFRFSPAKIGNEKVAVRILYKYRFRLGGNG